MATYHALPFEPKYQTSDTRWFEKVWINDYDTVCSLQGFHQKLNLPYILKSYKQPTLDSI